MKNKPKALNLKEKDGFTLLELAIVMLIVAFLMAGAVLGVPQYFNQKKIEATNEKMDLVMNALSSYVQRHYRLPCPANLTGLTRGQEFNNGDCFLNQGGTPQVNDFILYAQTQGVVPWRELGISESDVMDGWGRYFTYRPSPHLTVNTYENEMLGVADAGLGAADPIDDLTHNACRKQTWFSSDALHMNRQKALFCCNAEPKQDYIDDNFLVGPLTPTWKNNAIAVAGSDTDGDSTTDSVISSLEWIDDYNTTYDGTSTAALAGSFDEIYRGQADATTLRATSHAVTLISHGSNGAFSFLRDDSRKDGVFTGNLANPVITDIESEDEQKSVWPPAPFAALIGHPKSIVTDTSGLREEATDDIIKYLRTDQLMAKVGDGSCVKPIGQFGCSLSTFANFGFLLDSSSSMVTLFGDVKEIDRLGNYVFNGSNEHVIKTDANRFDAAAGVLRLLIRQLVEHEITNDTTPENIGMSVFVQPPVYEVSDGIDPYLDRGEFFLNALLVDPHRGTILFDPNTGLPSINPSTFNPYTVDDFVLNYLTGQPYGHPETGAPYKPEWRRYALNDTVNIPGAGGSFPIADITVLRLLGLTNSTSASGGTPLYHTLVQMAIALEEDAAANGSSDEPSGILVVTDGANGEYPTHKTINSIWPDLPNDANKITYFLNEITRQNDPSYPGYPGYPADPEDRFYEGFTIPSDPIEVLRRDPGTGDIQAFTVTIEYLTNNITDADGNDPNLTASELFGALVKANFPHLRIHTVDVGSNPEFGLISLQTGGSYIPADNDDELTRFLDLLTTCNGSGV